MSSLPTDLDSRRGDPAVTSTDTSASSDSRANPLWLLVIASALFFALAAALLAST